MATMIGFTGSPLDRADRLRHDAEGLAAAESDWRARLLKLTGLDPEMDGQGRLVWTSLADAAEDAELILLGLLDGKPHFVALDPALKPSRVRSPALFRMLDLLAEEDAATYGTARSLLDWHMRHRFCANCGSATRLFRAGWGRTCAECRAEHFPRVDPVAIMIAEHEGRALLGRQAAWPVGRYSALAGFIEPGESIEEAVARELEEESGVKVGAVRYVASQPWPFPAQLMIGCVAQATDPTITVDRTELEDAAWFSRDEVRAALAGDPGAPFGAPPRYAIAHSLLAHWAEGSE